MPTGRDDVKLSNGAKLDPSSQPGTGSYDFQLGLAYSRFLTANLTLDASAIYTFRTELNGFEVGDRPHPLAFASKLLHTWQQCQP